MLFMVCLISVFGCTAKKFLYDLNLPYQRIDLSSILNEISGLAMVSDSVLVAVQDEKGRVYYIDANSGEITDYFSFSKKGDYEGIAYYKDFFYVLRSDGKLFKVNRDKENTEYSFKKNKDFDFEGLCVDSVNKRLLLACKTHGNKKKRDHFYIYAFSLESESFEKDPVFKINQDEVDKDFKPSGIAVHPNGNIYIVSSFAKGLLELTSEGKVKTYVKLDKEYFHQPEGITFNSKGDLFISNEKNKETPTILRFNKK